MCSFESKFPSFYFGRSSHFFYLPSCKDRAARCPSAPLAVTASPSTTPCSLPTGTAPTCVLRYWSNLRHWSNHSQKNKELQFPILTLMMEKERMEPETDEGADGGPANKRPRTENRDLLPLELKPDHLRNPSTPRSHPAKSPKSHPNACTPPDSKINAHRIPAPRL